jgi:hypothetical protein
VRFAISKFAHAIFNIVFRKYLNDCFQANLSLKIKSILHDEQSTVESLNELANNWKKAASIDLQSLQDKCKSQLILFDSLTL